MVSWDVAERTIESTSGACRYSLEEVLEQPAGSLSAACEAEVGRILEAKAHYKAGAGKPRRGGDKSGTDAPTTSSRTGPKSEQTEDHATQAATVVLTFVTLVLVAVVALAYCASVGRPKRGGRRLHKKKQERIRERGKKRR
ncbi:unnamed protein product [Ectocarpus sp. 12 AP-2014]